MQSGGMMPTLAQDLAAAGSNFQDNREFQDYIYSKLLLADDKSASQVCWFGLSFILIIIIIRLQPSAQYDHIFKTQF